MMNKTKILTIRFENEIRREEIACFRGAIINAMENADVLFHNHTDDDSLRYAYRTNASTRKRIVMEKPLLRVTIVMVILRFDREKSICG